MTPRSFTDRLAKHLSYRKTLDHGEGKISIIGCGRSGTTYTSKLFQEAGFSIGHESLARHGISSWYATPNTWKRCYGPAQKELRLLNIPQIHQVRYPIKTIASASTVNEQSWQFIAQFIPIEKEDSMLLKSMKYWYYWNKIAQEHALFTYQVEEIEQELPKILSVGGFDTERFDSRLVKRFPKDVNKRDHDSLTWDALRTEDPDLTDMIISLAEHYGYTIR